MTEKSFLPESINANEIDIVGADFLNWSKATLEVKCGVAKLTVEEHAFHFEKVPMPIEWDLFQYGIKSREPQPIPRDEDYTRNGYLDLRIFDAGRKFIVIFISDIADERPFVIRVGDTNAKS